MKLIIIGGGKVAYYLIRELEREHEIVIIEQSESAATRIANQLSVVVVHGDGTSAAILESVCSGADMLIALTGKDENNLIACQMAKRHFGVPMTLARVNNPKNLEVMKKFGVDKSFSGTQILAEMIEQEIDYVGLRIVQTIKNSDRVLVEFHLSPHSRAVGKNLISYDFVADTRVVIITTKEGDVITPFGSTVMHADDLMMMVCSRDDLEAIWETMVKR